MAKQLLLSVLVDTLGKYVEGLNDSNLKIGVWSGKVQLENLKLKSGVLDKLNLPITVKHGSLKKLKLKVPWASLDSKPVRVILDGLYIVASPLDISSLSPDQVKWMAAQDKKSKLQNAEMLILKTGESSNESGAGSKSSYLQHYAAKIADNLEITITNIHIRYEDSQTIQGAVFSTGITLDTLSLSTTDEFWNEMFVSRSAQHAIHKLGKVVNLGVYWNTNSEECTHMTPEARESWLEHLIYRASDRQSSPSPNPSTTKSSVSSLNYLLAPPNSLLIKIAHSDKPGPDDAMIDMTIEIPPFGITLDRLQYQQLMSTLVGFSRLARQKQMALYRPTKRPTRDPKGWWKYAFLLVTGKEFCVASKFDQFLQGLHYRKRYIELVKFMRRSGQGQGQSIADILAGKPPVPLTSEEAELEKIEDLLPVHMLIQFRRIAAIEMRASELKLQRPSSALTQKSSGSASTFSAETKSKKKSMMSWMWGSKSASTPKEATESSSFSLAIDEDVSIEQLVSELESAVEQAEKRAENQDLTQLRLNFSSKVIINLTSDHLPLAQLQVAVKAAIEAKAVSNVMSFYVDDFLFVDQYTRNPICPYLIAARTYRDAHNVGVKPSASQTNLDKLKQEGADLQSQLSVIFQTKANGALFLRITAAPVDIVWNRDCMQKLLAFLLSSQDVESLLSDRQMVVSMDKFASQVALPQASMDMIIEIDAPKIIIPENCSRSDCGGILLDTGVLCVKGHTSSLGISFGISLSAIHLGMPPNLDKFVVKTGHEIETMTVTQKSRYQPMSISYLIKPFSISLAMQTIETGLAEFTMAISVTDVQAEFDANKIIKLIRIFNTMTLSFAAANEEARLNVLSVSDATTDAIVKWSRGEVDQATNLSIQEDLDILKGVKQSPTIVMLGIMITIPSISITLRVGNNHFIRLVGSTIQATIQQRVYDMHVAFQLCSISLEDSLRCKNQTFLIWTEKDNEAIGGQNVESCLVTFVYKAISSKMSPYYRGFAGEIDLNFTKLSLSLDNLALIRLKPVATEISEGLAELQREFIIAEAAILGAQTVEKQNLRAVLVAKSVAVSALRGITVGIEVDNVSLLLLRRPTAQSARYSEEPMSPHLTTILGENLFSSREGASKSPLRSKSGMENIELETAFSLSISGLSFSMEALDTDMKLDVDLSSFTVVDVRPTVHYVFKELICQSTIASQYSTTHQKKAKRSQKTGFSPPPSSKEVKDSKLLSLIFKTSGPPSAQVQHLDITLRNITSFLNLDAVLELADICMTDVDAFLGLLACFNNEPAVETKPTSVETLHGSPVVVSKNNISRPIEKSQPKRPDRVASIQPTGQKVPSLHVEEDAPMTSCFSVHVAVTNPRIILMENPERRNSRAIVCPFEIMFTYSNDTQDVKKSEMREIIQASLRDFEIFVLLEGVDSSKQHQIVEPTGIELHLSRRMEENILLSCSMYCDSRTVNGKVSVSDIKLVTKILNKAQLTTESTMKKQQSNRNVTPDKQALRRSIDNSQQLSLRQSLDKKQTSGKSVKDLAVYEITLHFGSIRIIAINDYYGQILPVLRMRLNDSDFHGTGILGMGDFFATGNFILSVEYFNAPLGVWEPILERCTPELTFTSKDERNMSFEVSHLSGILQITASGTMIREVSKTALLVTRSDLATANDCVVEEGSLLSFRNRLGVPIDVFESSSKRLVLSLPDYQIVQFPIEKFLTKAARASDNPLASFPNYFDIRVKGGYEDEREPLLALPLNVSKSKMYFLQPTAEIGAASATIPIEPILEEIYECERYSPMLQRWTDPWIGDPPRWTDAFARSKSAPDEFEINSRWHWLEPEWTVECLPNEKGKNVDAEGWQYGSVFGLFYSSTQKRTQKPADCCRRRKWVRTRTMADINQHRVDERKLAPIPIYWEPSIDKRTGCRLVEIKSCFQIKNTLKFPVQILLGGLACNSRNNSHGKDSSLYDSIPPNENWSVPLKLSHASSLHVRPLGVELNGAEVDGDWSQQFDCGLSTLGAKDRGRTMTLHADCPCGVDSNITFKVLLRRTGQLLTVVFAPYAVIHNYLPCTLHYRTLYGEGDVGQKGQLNPGHSDFFSSLDVHKKPKLSITAGTSVSGIGATPGIFHWSNQISFKEYLDDASKSLQMVVDIVDKNSSEKSVMSVVIATKMMTSDDGADYLAIFIYSKFILVNRTHIPISIRGFRNTNQNGSDKKPNYIPQERRSFGALSVRDLEGSWAKGSNNVVLFHSDNDDVQIGVDDGETWSSLISLSEVGVPKTQFEVNNPSRHVTYPLAYSLVTLPGLFRQTQVLTVMAGFMVVNTLSEKVSLEQVFNGSSNSKRDVDVDLLSVDPQCSSAWIKSLDARDMRVRLRTGSTQWSCGCVDLAGVGTTVLILPRMISTNTTAGDSGGLAVVHVEVKLSDASDHSYVSIVIWSTEKENTPDSNVATASLSFQNLTDQPLTLLQAGADKVLTANKIEINKFDLSVGPNSWKSFGWVDPNLKSEIK